MGASFLVAVTFVLISAVTSERPHPGSGLEVSAEGFVYVADVARETIWRIAPDGAVEPLVQNAWTHEFHLLDREGPDGEPAGTLVYEREHTGRERAPQSVNQILPDGERRVLIPPPPDRARFGSNAFFRGPDGVVTFAHTVRGVDGKWRAIIRQRDPDDHDGSRVRTIAGSLEGPLYRDGPALHATFRMILDIRQLADGTIVLLDRDRVRRLVPDGAGSFTTHTQGSSLIDTPPKDPPTRGGPETTWNRLYGLAVDADGNALVAYHGGRRVLRITPEGAISTIHDSGRRWAPLGVAIGPSGEVYVSEIADRGGRLRVLRLKQKAPEIVATIPPE